MLFLNPEDFFEKARACARLTREEELRRAEEMKAGSEAARDRLIQGYLPQVAGHVSRLSEDLITLEVIYRCCHALEKAVDSFNFAQEGERFSHRLSWGLRQAVTGYIADRP